MIRKDGGGLLCPFRGGWELGPRLTQCGLGQGLLPYQVASSSIEPFSHNRHGPKIGWGAVPFFLGSWVPIKDKVAWAEACLCNKWHLGPSSHLATIDMGLKLGGSVPFLGRGAGSPSSTMWPGPRPTCVPSFILIHPAVWPVATIHQRHRQTGQRDRQRSVSIGRTVLQTVAQKLDGLQCVWGHTAV